MSIPIDGIKLAKAYVKGSSINDVLGLTFEELSVAQQTDIIAGVTETLNALARELHQIEGVVMTFDVRISHSLHPAKHT